MVVVPVAMAITSPDEEPIEATPKTELPHVPPVVASLKVIVFVRQTDTGPVIPAGTGLTVMEAVLKQPVPIMV